MLMLRICHETSRLLIGVGLWVGTRHLDLNEWETQTRRPDLTEGCVRNQDLGLARRLPGTSLVIATKRLLDPHIPELGVFDEENAWTGP